MILCNIENAGQADSICLLCPWDFGWILKEHLSHWRDELIISTKAGYEMWAGPYGNWGSRKHILSSLDQSLKRLQLDYIDIFYHHRMDPNTPLEETMLALAQAVQSGKALYVGLSNYDGPTMEKACAILEGLKVPYIINQNCYNLLDKTVESNGLLSMTREKQKGLITFSPLAQGQLSNRYLNGIPNDSRVIKDSRFLKKEVLTANRLAYLRELNKLAMARGETLAQMALQWLLRDSAITSVLIGASKVSQILENIQVINSKDFSEEELTQIDHLVSKMK